MRYPELYKHADSVVHYVLDQPRDLFDPDDIPRIVKARIRIENILGKNVAESMVRQMTVSKTEPRIDFVFKGGHISASPYMVFVTGVWLFKTGLTEEFDSEFQLMVVGEDDGLFDFDDPFGQDSDIAEDIEDCVEWDTPEAAKIDRIRVIRINRDRRTKNENKRQKKRKQRTEHNRQKRGRKRRVHDEY